MIQVLTVSLWKIEIGPWLEADAKADMASPGTYRLRFMGKLLAARTSRRGVVDGKKYR